MYTKNNEWKINTLHKLQVPIINNSWWWLNNKKISVTQEINLSPKNYTKYNVPNTTLILSQNNVRNNIICLAQNTITIDNTAFICTTGLQYPFQNSANSSQQFFTAMSMAINSKSLNTQNLHYDDPSLFENINDQLEEAKITVAQISKLHLITYYSGSAIAAIAVTIICCCLVSFLYKNIAQTATNIGGK